MAEGWIKLHRQCIERGWFKNRDLWAFWTFCLLKASHSRVRLLVGFQQVELEPGQFVFGLKKASEEMGLSIRTIRTCLDKLETMGNLARKTTNKFSIITITNWDTYQGDESASDKQSDKQATSKRQASDKQEAATGADSQTFFEGDFLKSAKSDNKQEDKNLRKDQGIKNKNTARARERSDVVLPEWLEPSEWDAFREHRLALRSKMTTQAERLIIRKLDVFRQQGQDPVAVLAQSIERGWKGVFAVNGDSNGRGRQPNRMDGVLSPNAQQTLANGERWIAKRRAAARQEEADA
jgi:hypothetical protein